MRDFPRISHYLCVVEKIYGRGNKAAYGIAETGVSLTGYIGNPCSAPINGGCDCRHNATVLLRRHVVQDGPIVKRGAESFTGHGYKNGSMIHCFNIWSVLSSMEMASDIASEISLCRHLNTSKKDMGVYIFPWSA